MRWGGLTVILASSRDLVLPSLKDSTKKSQYSRGNPAQVAPRKRRARRIDCLSIFPAPPSRWWVLGLAAILGVADFKVCRSN